jgi:hypothetical protein
MTRAAHRVHAYFQDVSLRDGDGVATDAKGARSELSVHALSILAGMALFLLTILVPWDYASSGHKVTTSLPTDHSPPQSVRVR